MCEDFPATVAEVGVPSSAGAALWSSEPEPEPASDGWNVTKSGQSYSWISVLNITWDWLEYSEHFASITEAE